MLRKHRGRLVLTNRGRSARADPPELWWQLAERMPLTSSDGAERQAGLVFLVLMAAGATDDADQTIAEMLGAIGWTTDDGRPLTATAASRAVWDTRAVLRRTGALPEDPGIHRRAQPTAEGVAFARAALRTWPD